MNSRSYPFDLISDYVYEYNKFTKDTPYEIIDMKAEELFLADRIDLVVKYNLIECRESGTDITKAEELYIKHIEAFTDGMYLEAGNPQKDSIRKYIDTFYHLIDEFKKNGFDSNISLIPIGKGNVILDGSHRVACAAYLGQKVTAIRFNNLSVCYDYKYFKKHLLGEEYLEFMVQKYCDLKDNSFMAFIWPKAYKERNLIIKRLKEYGCKYIYIKKLKLSYEKFFYIIYHIYKKEPWIGNERNRYHGISQKAKWCYEKNGCMEILVFEGIREDQINQIKKVIRSELGYKKHSMHITDTREETLEALNLIMTMEKKETKIQGDIINTKRYKMDFLKKKTRNLYARVVILIKKGLGIPV